MSILEVMPTFICLDCGYIFENPKWWIELHGLNPPWEEWSGCPNCSGAYTGAIKCDICGEYITGTYVEVSDGQFICEGCYTEKEIGE
jgi:hypothetical protein